MKLKFLRLIPVIILMSTALLSCSSDDMTKVTIYFGEDGQAAFEQKNLPLIDRFLNLFGSKAYAQIHAAADTAYYFLYVTADDMDTVYTPLISGTYSSITVDVPSGVNRVFTLLSFSPDGNYNYVGQEVEDLAGGETSISINMYPCLNNITITYVPPATAAAHMYITWTYDTTLSNNSYNTVKIYRACYGTDSSCDGSIDTVATTAGIYASVIGSGEYSDYSISYASGDVYYYLLTVNIDSGAMAGSTISIPGNFMDFFSEYYFIAAFMMGSNY